MYQLEDCLFCKMARHEIEPAIVYEDDDVLAFKDIKPLAPVHVLLIPKKHLANLNEMTEADIALLGRIQMVAKTVAAQLGLAESGYRLVMNCGPDSGQEVFHLHFHLLGGRFLGPFTK